MYNLGIEYSAKLIYFLEYEFKQVRENKQFMFLNLETLGKMIKSARQERHTTQEGLS